MGWVETTGQKPTLSPQTTTVSDNIGILKKRQHQDMSNKGMSDYYIFNNDIHIVQYAVPST